MENKTFNFTQQHIRNIAEVVAKHKKDEKYWTSQVSVEGVKQFDEDGTIDHLGDHDNDCFYEAFSNRDSIKAIMKTIDIIDEDLWDFVREEVNKICDNDADYLKYENEIYKREREAFGEDEEEEDED